MPQSVSTTTKQKKRGRGAGYSFVHSLYITKAWNWFLEFMGRAAEAILVISVLYASVKLLPVVHMPASLDVIVFIAQFVALDVGGLSLGKLAKQALAEGNEEGAKQAGRMSKALITVMIAGVVVVAIEQLFPLPANWKLGIDTVLLIARSILAVLYGHIIHTLRNEDLFDQAQPHDDSHQQPRFEQALTDLQTDFEQRLAAEIASTQERISALVQPAPVIDYDRLIQGVARQFETQFQETVRRLEAEMRQRVLVSPAPETRQREKKPVSHPLVSLPAPRPLRRATLSQESKVETAITALLDQDKSRKVRDLAQLAGTSTATAGRIRKAYFEAIGQAVSADETETDSAS